MTWHTARLDEIAEIVGGSTPKTGVAEYWNGDVPWVTPADLSNLPGAYIGETQRMLTAAGLSNSGAPLLAVGSVLLSSRAPIGHVAINAVPMATNQGFKSLVPDQTKAHAKYLYWWLKANKTYLQSLGNGATFKEVSKAVVSRVEVPLPSVPEQRRIAAILDQADELRTKRRQALKLLDEFADSVFTEMFGASVTSSAQWPLGRVSSFTAGFQSGKSLASPAEGDSSNVGQRILKISSVTTGVFKPHESKPLPLDYQAPAAHSVHAGDLLMSRANTSELVGACAYVWGEPEGLVLPDKIWRFKWKDARDVEPLFVRAAISRPEFRRAISGIASGSSGSMKNISQEAFLGLSIIQPNIAAQAAFAGEMRLIHDLVTSQHNQVHVLDELFASLQHRAFRGEL